MNPPERIPRSSPCSSSSSSSRKRSAVFRQISLFCVVLICLQQIYLSTRYAESNYIVQSDSNNCINDGPSVMQAQEKLKKFVVPPEFKVIQDEIDTSMNAIERCAQYGVKPLSKSRSEQRRIFFGSLVADENPEVMLAHAIEVYNKYEIVALIESNTTFFGTARNMKYGPNSEAARSLTETDFFGNATKVVMGYWMENYPGLIGMDREQEQRNTILKAWIDQGMTKYDIGLVSDLDEIASRDALIAIKECDFPQLRYEHYPSCKEPKMILSNIQFDGSPLCVKKNEWYHPDVMPGHCIEGLGEPTGRMVPTRSVSLKEALEDESMPDGGPKIFGWRDNDWGQESRDEYPQHVKDSNLYPLWNAAEIRANDGATGWMLTYVNNVELGHGTTAQFGSSFHLHNWFTDLKVMRNKYLTFGHYDHLANEMPLGSFSGDVGMMVRCVHGMGNVWMNPNGTTEKVDDSATWYHVDNTLLPEGERDTPSRIIQMRAKQGWGSVGGNRPIYFHNRSYVKDIHERITKMVIADEEEFGMFYDREMTKPYVVPNKNQNDTKKKKKKHKHEGP